MKDIEVVVFNDKSWVRFTDYQKSKEENKQLQKNNKHIRDLIEAERQRQEECNNVHLRDIVTLEKENEKLQQQIEEMKNCYNCSNFCDRNVDCSSICVRNNPTVKQLKDYWKMKDIY